MRKIYTSIDIGTSYVKVLVSELILEKVYVLASSSVKSKGIKKGLIVDANEAVISIKEAISNVEGKLGIKIDKIIANVPSYNVNYDIVSGYTEVNSEDFKVDGNDILKAIQNGVSSVLDDTRELVSIIPIDFVLDGNNMIKDPKGLVGHKLEAKCMMVTTPQKNVHSIMGILESIGIKITDVNIGPIADYETFRTKEIDKDMVAIINIGGETTTVSLFNKGIIVNSEILKIGGNNIDNDISYVFKLSSEDSKKIKEKFALAHKKFAKINEVHEMLTTDRDLVKINQYDLSQVVMSRLEEILELAKKQLFLLTNKEIKYIIITGGSSELPQMQYIVDEIFVNNAYVSKIEDIGIRSNKYSTVVGLIKFFDKKLKMRGKEYSMFSIDKQQDISIPKRKGIGEDSILGKVFGIFFD